MINRTLTEVLKFGSAEDLLREASVVNQLWSRVANSDEVWWTLCETINSNYDTTASPKVAFRELAFYPKQLLFVLYDKVKLISVEEIAAGRFDSAVTTLSLHTPVDNSGAYCFVTPKRVLCFGAGNSPGVLEINLQTLSLVHLPDMCDRRWYPGLLRYQHYIYVFGGRVTSCQKLNLRTRSWEAIQGHLHDPLEALMPAEHQQVVYLAGFITVETFHLETEEFSSLPFGLPRSWWYTICLVHEDDLVVIQEHCIERWKLGSSETGFRIHHNEWASTAYYSNCLPVWHNGKFYTLHNEIPAVCGAFEFDPVENKLTEVMHWPAEYDKTR